MGNVKIWNIHLILLVPFNEALTWYVIGHGTCGVYPADSSNGKNSLLKFFLHGFDSTRK